MEYILSKTKVDNVYIANMIAIINYKLQTKSKYAIFYDYFTNMFMPKEEREELLQIIQKSQRIYNGFSRFLQLYKHKYVKTTISTDMYLNEIQINHKSAICIRDKSTNYWFMISDLCRHISASLSNAPYYFAEPLEIKNPYTNIPFTHAQLYTIYFKLRTNNDIIVFPYLFHKFFLCNFNINKFRVDNETELRESSIRRHIQTTEDSKLYSEILLMLFHHNHLNTRIHKLVPKKEFISIMRPYLYLYIVSKCHIRGIEKVVVATDVLRDKIEELFDFNPQFGRMYLTRKHVAYFNLKHPKFGMEDAIQSLSLP